MDIYLVDMIVVTRTRVFCIFLFGTEHREYEIYLETQYQLPSWYADDFEDAVNDNEVVIKELFDAFYFFVERGEAWTSRPSLTLPLLLGTI